MKMDPNLILCFLNNLLLKSSIAVLTEDEVMFYNQYLTYFTFKNKILMEQIKNSYDIEQELE